MRYNGAHETFRNQSTVGAPSSASAGLAAAWPESRTSRSTGRRDRTQCATVAPRIQVSAQVQNPQTRSRTSLSSQRLAASAFAPRPGTRRVSPRICRRLLDFGSHHACDLGTVSGALSLAECLVSHATSRLELPKTAAPCFAPG